MSLVFAIAVGVLFGCGAYLALKGDLFRVVVGIVLVSNAANLTVIAAGQDRGQPPVRPFEEGQPVSDPLVQAMTLTAIVIGFGVTALLLGLAYRVYVTHRSVDFNDLTEEEQRTERELEREEIEV